MLDDNTVTVFLGVLTVSVTIFYILIYGRAKTRPPGPWGLPIFGHLLFIDKYAATTFRKWAQVYGNIFSIRMGSYKAVVLNGYDVVKAAAEFDNDIFSDRINFLSFGLQKELNEGVYTLTSSPFDGTYIQARKGIAMALKTFTKRQNNILAGIASQAADDLKNTLILKGKNGVIDIFPDLNNTIGTILYKVVYGRGNDVINVKKQLNVYFEANKYFDEFANKGNLADFLPWRRYFIPDKISKFAKSLTMMYITNIAEIKRHRDTFSEYVIDDITDFLINDEQNNTKTSIEARKIMFNSLKELFAAGFDTSATTLKYAILIMVANPDIQKKVQTEIDCVVGYGRAVDLNDRETLPYTNAVIYEVLRITSIVPFAIPHKTLHTTEFMGYHIDEGTFVTFNLASVNNEQEYWGDPGKFRPERFMDDSGHLIRERCNRVASFSFGRRGCVGEQFAKQQVFIVFATLMQHCAFVSHDGEQIDLDPIPGLIYHPKSHKLIVKERINE